MDRSPQSLSKATDSIKNERRKSTLTSNVSPTETRKSAIELRISDGLSDNSSVLMYQILSGSSRRSGSEMSVFRDFNSDKTCFSDGKEKYRITKGNKSILPFLLVPNVNIHRFVLDDFEVMKIWSVKKQEGLTPRQLFHLGMTNLHLSRYTKALKYFTFAYETKGDLEFGKWVALTSLVLLLSEGKNINFYNLRENTLFCARDVNENENSFFSFLFSTCAPRKEQKTEDLSSPFNLAYQIETIIKAMAESQNYLVEGLFMHQIVSFYCKFHPKQKFFKLKSEPKTVAKKILQHNKYFGYLAYAEHSIFESNSFKESKEILLSLIKKYPNRPEAYVKLFSLLKNNKIKPCGRVDMLTNNGILEIEPCTLRWLSNQTVLQNAPILLLV